jgi:hypothetical protein
MLRQNLQYNFVDKVADFIDSEPIVFDSQVSDYGSQLVKARAKSDKTDDQLVAEAEEPPKSLLQTVSKMITKYLVSLCFLS